MADRRRHRCGDELPRRRWALTAGVAVVLLAATGCATKAVGPVEAPGERIVDATSGLAIRSDALLAALRDSDVVVLGEQHDNPRHHRLRGELLAALGPATSVVAEQLPRRGPVTWQADSSRDPLPALRAAGFDADAWGWPLHEPLFGAVARAGLPLQGGDLERDSVRRVARDGEAGLPEALVSTVRNAPLPAAAQAALDGELLASHCGMLPAARVPAMRAAQRARDASLWTALRDSGGRPAVLVAGNGHARLDYGVPQLARAEQPAARVVSVAFLDAADDLSAARGRYTYVWLTAPPADRGDPCAAFAPKAPAG